MSEPTTGHTLFEAWLIRVYGESSRRPGRPRYDGLRQTREAIAAELTKLQREMGASRVEPPRQAIGLYHWLASAKPSCRRVPGEHIRVAIELITAGEVPRASWERAVGVAA